MTPSRFTWATVDQINPVRIRLDGDVQTLDGIPTMLIQPTLLSIGNRVRVEVCGRQIIVHGRAYVP